MSRCSAAHARSRSTCTPSDARPLHTHVRRATEGRGAADGLRARTVRGRRGCRRNHKRRKLSCGTSSPNSRSVAAQRASRPTASLLARLRNVLKVGGTRQPDIAQTTCPSSHRCSPSDDRCSCAARGLRPTNRSGDGMRRAETANLSGERLRSFHVADVSGARNHCELGPGNRVVEVHRDAERTAQIAIAPEEQDRHRDGR